MTIARIEDGRVAEQREMDITDVPSHKRGLWKPIEGEPPAHDPRTETISGPVLIIEPGRVRRQWTVTRIADDHLRNRIKAECARRILARFPDWKQANMTARGVELQDQWRRNGGWTEAEQMDANALAGAWAWIKSVRAASDALEQTSPIPADYEADSRWPA